MELRSTEEQKLLADSVERFLAKEYRRPGRAGHSRPDGLDRAMWSRIAELGWLGIGIDEALGGVGGGAIETGIVMEGIGRHLVAEPYLASCVVAGGLLVEAGAAEAARIAAGELVAALAHAEPRGRYDFAHVETRAGPAPGGYRLDGHKAVVPFGAEAELLLVSARISGASRDTAGLALFRVPRGAAGLGVRGYATADGLRAAEITLDGVTVGADAAVGPVGGAWPLLERARDRALVALACEAVGAMDALVALTRDYLRTRKQFGVPIGSFQVLQHRLVDMYMAAGLARSLTEMAARALADPAEDARERARLAAAAKVEAGRAGRLVGQEAVQLHGGMGMTDELVVGRYFKRLTMIDLAFGDADHHRRRFAALAAA